MEAVRGGLRAAGLIDNTPFSWGVCRLFFRKEAMSGVVFGAIATAATNRDQEEIFRIVFYGLMSSSQNKPTKTDGRAKPWP